MDYYIIQILINFNYYFHESRLLLLFILIFKINNEQRKIIKFLLYLKTIKSKKMYTIYFKKIPIITILLTSFAIVWSRINSLVFENSLAHNFSRDESAYFLTIVDKIKVEAQLAANSTGSNNNNQGSAQQHANNAILNYDSNTKSEISE